MRRLLRLLFMFVMSVISFVPVLLLFDVANKGRSLTLIFPAGLILCIVVSIIGCIFLNKEEPHLFWITAVPLSLCFAAFAFVGGIRLFYSQLILLYIKDVTLAAILVFWYGISTRIISLSREEKLRKKETPSETELRHARERRDPSLDIAERERLNKMLASLPEKERQELLKKQAEYEANQNKE